MVRFRNCGVFGETTDDIANRLPACAHGADALIVQGGINDIAQGRPVEPAADNLRAMVQQGKALGLRVAITEVLPWNNGYPEADPKIRHLNELIRGTKGVAKSTAVRALAALLPPIRALAGCPFQRPPER